ncbi:MAG TPA: tyrosine-type recombinase/integrase [Candidatus Methylomirabilis sp.]|nr:tyrosine-type recombinase/integrase [Candidatus Methylomirabilis sp.]
MTTLRRQMWAALLPKLQSSFSIRRAQLSTRLPRMCFLKSLLQDAVSDKLGVRLGNCFGWAAAGISAGRLFRCVCRAGKHWGDGVTKRVVWHVVKQYARKLGIAQVAPHDLRRSCAKLCHASGGELDQIQFLLGHVSVQTTERYLGCKQRIRGAVNDHISIEPQLRRPFHRSGLPTSRPSGFCGRRILAVIGATATTRLLGNVASCQP